MDVVAVFLIDLIIAVHDVVVDDVVDAVAVFLIDFIIAFHDVVF